MPMVAEELWSMKATAAPVIYPRTGLLPRPENRFSMRPDWARLFTAPVMFSRPENRMPKPMAILPMDLEFLKNWPMMSTMPKIRAMGAKVEGWKKRRMSAPEASISKRRMIWPVTVVPTLAPMMMPRLWCRVKMPAPTRPAVMTMVAVELWMRAVTSTPRMKAFRGLSVTLPMATFRVPDEFSFRESPMRRMPYKNMARPPKREITLNISIK